MPEPRVYPYRMYQMDEVEEKLMGLARNPNAIGYIPVYESIEAMNRDHGNDCPSGIVFRSDD